MGKNYKLTNKNYKDGEIVRKKGRLYRVELYKDGITREVVREVFVPLYPKYRGPGQCKGWKDDLFSKHWRTGVAKLRFLAWWKYRDVINWFTRKKKEVVNGEKPYIFKIYDNDYEYGKNICPEDCKQKATVHTDPRARLSKPEFEIVGYDHEPLDLWGSICNRLAGKPYSENEKLYGIDPDVPAVAKEKMERSKRVLLVRDKDETTLYKSP